MMAPKHYSAIKATEAIQNSADLCSGFGLHIKESGSSGWPSARRFRWGRAKVLAMKYVLVTGGVVSGLGKGVTASSIGVILKACGHRVTSIKIGTCGTAQSHSRQSHESEDRCTVLYMGRILHIMCHACCVKVLWTGVLKRKSATHSICSFADPYLNTDAGTMSPFEHGEVFVLDDGGEVR